MSDGTPAAVLGRPHTGVTFVLRGLPRRHNPFAVLHLLRQLR